MKYIKYYEDIDYPIFEKSIGSENTRMKHYSDMDKHTFYNLVNTDPTSVRKKDFSKLGKYSKWLIREYKKGRITDDMLNDKKFRDRINYYLFISTTGWFRKAFSQIDQMKPTENGLMWDVVKTKNTFDILKYDLDTFIKIIEPRVEKYKKETENSKFDYLYTDKNMDVLIPLNFSASYEISKNTDWCSKHPTGFHAWNHMAILYRVIFKDGEKLKITWAKDNESCHISISKYPEINTYTDPFEKDENGKERWYNRLKEVIDNLGGTRMNKRQREVINMIGGDDDKTEKLYSDAEPERIKHYKEIGNRLVRIPDSAKESIQKHYNRNKKI